MAKRKHKQKGIRCIQAISDEPNLFNDIICDEFLGWAELERDACNSAEGAPKNAQA